MRTYKVTQQKVTYLKYVNVSKCKVSAKYCFGNCLNKRLVLQCRYSLLNKLNVIMLLLVHVWYTSRTRRIRLKVCIHLSLDLFLPITLHIPFNVLSPFQHYLLISYMLLPDVGIWCNSLVCENHAQHVLHHDILSCFCPFCAIPTF